MELAAVIRRSRSRAGVNQARSEDVRRNALGGAALALVLACAGAAQAQTDLTPFDRDIASDVLSRPHPDYDPLGIRYDGFLFMPTLELNLTGDDNIYGLPRKTGDVYGAIKPQLTASSQWGRNALSFNLGAEFDEFVDHTQESTDQFNASALGRIDVDHNSAINLMASDALITEPRTAPDSLGASDQPVQYTEGQLSATGYRTFDRFRLTATVNFADFQYQNVRLADGQVYNESIRNEDTISETIRADYAVGPKIAVFASISPNQAIFESTKPVDYNSDGLSVLGGVNFQVTHLIEGEIGIGYYSQRYESALFGNVSGFDYNSTIKYFPTQLLTLTLKLQHAVAPSGIPQSPSTLTSEATLTADYELLRNCVISAHGDFNEYNYPGLSRRDDRYGAGLRVRYLVNRGVTLTLAVNHLNQTSVGLGRGYDFDDNQVTLGVSLKR